MARIACLWVCRFPLTALLRVEPELHGIPVAITDGCNARSPVITQSPEAQDAGVQPGMTAAQARALCATLVVRPRSAEALGAARNALADVAGSISARVELTEDGTVFLDCAGSAALCTSEADLATMLVARATHQGLTACVGIGSSKLVARIAAREGGDVRIVPRGSERAYLAPLPITLLDPDAVLTATLASWGLRQIGDLAALPAGAVTHRLGPAGARLVRRARGEDDEPLRCRPVLKSFVEATELDYAIEQIAPLLFLLRRLVDRLVSRLALHGFTCDTLEVRLALDGGGRDLRRLAIAAPTAEGKVLLALLRAHLERQPPARGVIGIDVTGIPVCMRPKQLDLFQPNGPAPTALAATIARLAALCGSDRVGTPGLAESHRPDAIAIASFPARSAPPPWSGAAPNGVCFQDDVPAGGCRTPAPRASSMPFRGAARTVSPRAESLPIVARVALRAFRPPLSIEVFENAGRLDYVRGPVLGGRVVHLAGPWRLHGDWWAADPYAREYYDVELSDGGVYRIYRDAHTRRWLVDGVYD
jgi:protein ImuB